MARPQDAKRVVEIPGPWQHRYVAANGARFHVAECTPDGVPDPPLVLLLHGFPEFWWAWRDQLPALAGAGYRAVAMDLRGYGGSDKTPRGYDPFTLAQDVSGVVKALGERSAVVVGHDWGGYVAWAAAVLEPREVSALCAVSAPHPRATLRLLRAGRSFSGLGHLVAMQTPMLPERRISRPQSGYLAKHLEGWSSPRSDFPDNATLATYQDAVSLWPAAHCALEYHRWFFRSQFRYDGRLFGRMLERPVQQPVCTIDGTDDPAVPGTAAEVSGASVLGPFEAHLVPDAGHFPQEEQPDDVTRILLSWLSRNAP